jgi:hypothetical protein
MTSTKPNTVIFVETKNNTTSLAAPVETRSAVPKQCRPFSLSVMVFNPEAGYKFEIEIEKNCTDSNDTIWKLVFLLYKKINGQFENLVAIKFTAQTPGEAEKVAEISDNGLSRPQVRAFRDEVFTQAKPLADENRDATPGEVKSLHQTVKKAIELT